MAFEGIKRLTGHREPRTGTGIFGKFNVHGSFKDKSAAVKRERETPHSFILERDTKHGKRYIVMVDKRKQ